MSPRAKKIVSASFLTVSLLIASAVQSDVIPAAFANLAMWGIAAINIVTATWLPALLGEDVPPKLADTVRP